MRNATLKNRYVYLILVSLLLSISLVSAGPAGFGRVKLQNDLPGFDAPEGVWVFTWTDTGYTTDKVRALFAPSDVQSDTGFETTGDFEISIDGTDNYCKYDIIQDADRLDIYGVDIISREEEYWAWTYNMEELRQKSIEILSELGCLQITGYEYGTPNYRLMDEGSSLTKDYIHVYCYKQKSSYGKIGTIRNLKYVTDTAWRVKAEGKSPITKTISNDATGEGRTSDLGSNVKIQWEGQLSSGDTCPIATEELMLHDGATWKIIGRHNYINYEDYMRGQLEDSIIKVACSEISSLSCPGVSRSNMEQTINGKAAKAATEKSFSDFNVNIISSSITTGALKIQLDKLIRFPMFRLFVDSDYLELLITYGIPQLICPSTTIEFNAGEAGKITVQAKNVGDAEGGFNVRVKSCTSGLEAGDTKGLTLQPDKSQDVTLRVTSTVPDDTLSGSCTIEMKESWTQETVLCTANLKVDTLVDCTEGNKWCDYDGADSVIMECKDGKEEIMQRCDLSCNYDKDGNPICLAENGNGGVPDCKWYQDPYSKEICGLKCSLGLAEPTTEMGCETASWVFWTILVSVVLTILIIWISIKFRRPRAPYYSPRRTYY